MYSVVTSFSQQGWDEYARECVRSFKENWPASVRLICYWEGDCPDEVSEGWNLALLEPCKSFLERHRDNLIVQGRSQSQQSPWGPKARAKGYSFRHDAYKFARKVFAVAHASRYCEIGKLFWMDADVITHSRVPEGLLHDILPDRFSICHLARNDYHTECGFVGYNLDRLETHAFIAIYEAAYAQDRFLAHQFWDDCHILDDLIDMHKPACLRIPTTSRGQPFDHSILGRFMTHLKGNRKLAV